MNELVAGSLIDLVTVAVIAMGTFGMLIVANGIYNALIDRRLLTERHENGDAAILVNGRIWRERLRFAGLALITILAGMLLVMPMTLAVALVGRLVMLALATDIVLTAVIDQRMRDAIGRLYERVER